MTKKTIALFLLLTLFSFSTQARTNQQALYSKAVNAINNGERTTFESIAGQLHGYTLEPYLDYYRVNKLTLGNKGHIDAFLRKYKNQPIANRLKSRWLTYLIKNKHYKSASQYSAPAYYTSTRCNILYAKTKVGQSANYQANKDLWLYGKNRPDACNAIFSYWKKSGAINAQAYGERAKQALKKGNRKLASKLAQKSTASVRNLVAWHKKRRNALYEAKSFPSNGYQMLNALPKSVQNDEVRSWKAKQFIFNANWQRLLQEIQKMPAKQRAKDQWRYWEARALARLGKRNQATALYKKVAKSSNYYGFLSADRLSLPYTICKKTKTINTSTFYKRFPGIQRAFELRRVNSPYFAGMEWNAAIRSMTSDDDIIKASILADRQGWNIRAILELGKIKAYQYYDVRFPMKWLSLVKKNAKRRGLTPAFVYAIMRTESAMRPDAKSPVGARGLMQLMPTTAKRTGKKYGLGGTSKSALLSPENNIPLGCAFLHQMGKQWNNQLILMIASYNAGPGNVRKWVKKLPKEADRFIESIPFDETHKYVTRVLDYTTMYNWKINKTAKRLGYRMSNIGSSQPFIKSSNVYNRPVCK